MFKYYNFKQGGYAHVLKYKDILILSHYTKLKSTIVFGVDTISNQYSTLFLDWKWRLGLAKTIFLMYNYLILRYTGSMIHWN